MMMLYRVFFVACLLCASAARAEIAWVQESEDGSARVQLYFFWSERCPHCREALPFVQSLEQDYPWVQVRSHELARNRDHVALYVEMANALGEEARSVPAFFVCGRMRTGYDSPDGMGRELLRLARLCRSDSAYGLEGVEGERHSSAATGNPSPERAPVDTIRLPAVGDVTPAELSLPLFTLIIAGLDAFNPCAFFVLLFLLSLMVHARSKARMLVIGGTFVVFSGLVYFMFMAAWLNLFLVVGGAPVVTLVAGSVAVIIGLLNTKDYFWFKQGPSLVIPEAAKPGLFRRMRGLLAADNTTAMLVGTVTLALAANSYELLCTAGFPMVYTRVLTLKELGALEYYAYLLLYNLIYVLPLVAIVVFFTWTLGARKLSERQARLLKLISGLMMLGLGIIMLVAPQLLDRLWVGVGLLVAALLIAVALSWLERRRGVRREGQTT